MYSMTIDSSSFMAAPGAARVEIFRFDEHQPVAGVVAHHSLDAVGPIGGLLHELHALGDELVVGLVAVVDAETEAAHLPLGQLAPYELGGLLVERRPGVHQGDLQLGLVGAQRKPSSETSSR